MAPVADFVPRGAPAQRCGVQPSPVHCGRNWDSKIREDRASVIGVSRIGSVAPRTAGQSGRAPGEVESQVLGGRGTGAC